MVLSICSSTETVFRSIKANVCYLNDKTQYLQKMEVRLPEEGMVFHTALPEMLAGLPRRSLKPVRAFLILEKIREITKKQQRSSLFAESTRLFLDAALVAQCP